MAWKPWPKVEPRSLAHYVTRDAVNIFYIGMRPDDRRLLAKAIYEALVAQNITYASEKYDPDAAIQLIRAPDEVLFGPREGTCLDLSLLFCGLCMGFELLPVLILLEGHALAAISLERGLRGWDEYGRTEIDDGDINSIEHFYRGLLLNREPLRKLVDEQRYLILECTGFAYSKITHGSTPEEQDREGGVLSFEKAVEIGRKQLDDASRPFQFALDIASLHYRWRIEPYTFLRKDFTDMVDIVGEVSGSIRAVVPLLQDQREKIRQALKDTYLIFNTTLNMVILRLGEILKISDAGTFLNEAADLDNYDGWTNAERAFRVCSSLRENLKKTEELVEEFKKTPGVKDIKEWDSLLNFMREILNTELQVGQFIAQQFHQHANDARSAGLDEQKIRFVRNELKVFHDSLESTREQLIQQEVDSYNIV